MTATDEYCPPGTCRLCDTTHHCGHRLRTWQAIDRGYCKKCEIEWKARQDNTIERASK